MFKYMRHSLYGEKGVIHGGRGRECSPRCVSLNLQLTGREIQSGLKGTGHPTKELGFVVGLRGSILDV